MQWNGFSEWLRIPAIDDPVDRRNAPMLQVVLLALGTLPPALWLYRIVASDIPWRPGETVSLSASLLISGIALWCVVLIRRGRFQSAIRRLMVVVVAVMSFSYAVNGVAAHIFEMPVHLLWLFVAGMMIGRKALWAMYAALVLVLLIGAGADVHAGRDPPSHAFGDAVVRAVMFLLIALVIDRSAATLRESLKDAMARSAELERTNAQLRTEMAARERAQAQLLHAQKMENVGRIASGVAHDFNHLLTLVLGHAARGRASATLEGAHEALLDVQSAARRASAVSRRLLDFGRMEIARPEIFDPAEAIAEMQPMLRQMFSPHTDLELQLQSFPGLIRFDRAQLELILLTLAANAEHAMPDGGRFTVALNRAGSRMLEIACRDNGHGMDAAVRERCLEPFFTTKPSGQGTGLGLAVAANLVQAAGGEIAVDSAPGQGTTVRITLPLAAQPTGSD
jgi:signal transduction histidine kinase